MLILEITGTTLVGCYSHKLNLEIRRLISLPSDLQSTTFPEESIVLESKEKNVMPP